MLHLGKKIVGGAVGAFKLPLKTILICVLDLCNFVSTRINCVEGIEELLYH